jgi:hypothetical protein
MPHTQTRRNNSVHVTASRIITVQDTCIGPSVTVLNIPNRTDTTQPQNQTSTFQQQL